MFSQTIALMRYQLLEIVNRRLLFLLAGLAILSVAIGQFVNTLALINSAAIALAAQAELLRYALVALMMVSVCHHIASHYEQGFFSRLLSMPVPRYQYVLVQLFAVFMLALLYALPVLVVIGIGSPSQALYWYCAVVLELALVGQIATLMSISLEKLTPAFLSSLLFYLFSKTLPLIQLGLEQRSSIGEDGPAFLFLQGFMGALGYLMPQYTSFAVNDLMFDQRGYFPALLLQLLSILVYGLLLQGVTLIDFYRKEFNET